MSENIAREQIFARSLEQVRRIAQEQGNRISRQQVEEEFAPLDLKEAQLEMVYDYLEKHRIGVDASVDPDAFLTEEERNYLQEYLDELKALPEYSPGEMEAYSILAMGGERQAVQKLTEGCLRDVADAAKLYAGQGVLLEDLIGEGNVALAAGVEMLGSMRDSGAIQSAAEVPGALMRLVMSAMERHIGECADNARTDRKVQEEVNRVADKARELAEQLRRKVTPSELAQETGMSLKTIQSAMRMSGYRIEDIEWKDTEE